MHKQKEQTPEQLAMIAAAEGRNAFANLRESHADLLAALKKCEAYFENISGLTDWGDLQEDDMPLLEVRFAIAKAEGNQ